MLVRKFIMPMNVQDNIGRLVHNLLKFFQVLYDYRRLDEKNPREVLKYFDKIWDVYRGAVW